MDLWRLVREWEVVFMFMRAVVEGGCKGAVLGLTGHRERVKEVKGAIGRGSSWGSTMLEASRRHHKS